MNQIALVKRQVRLAEWAEQIQSCKNSGMTVNEWCAANGISVRNYYYHLHQVRENVLDSIETTNLDLPAKVSDPEPIFKKLEVQSPVYESTQTIKIRLSNASVEIPDGISAQTVEAVLKALVSTC